MIGAHFEHEQWAEKYSSCSWRQSFMIDMKEERTCSERLQLKKAF